MVLAVVLDTHHSTSKESLLFKFRCKDSAKPCREDCKFISDRNMLQEVKIWSELLTMVSRSDLIESMAAQTGHVTVVVCQAYLCCLGSLAIS